MRLFVFTKEQQWHVYFVVEVDAGSCGLVIFSVALVRLVFGVVSGLYRSFRDRGTANRAALEIRVLLLLTWVLPLLLPVSVVVKSASSTGA